MIKKWQRVLSVILCVAMLCTQLPITALAYMVNGAKTPVTISTKDGAVTEDESWETTFPYGTFAFGDSQLIIAEGSGQGTIQVYRLGGTAGRATVYLTYEPVIPEIAQGQGTQAYAAGARDVHLFVEDTQQAAQYQPLGKPADPAVPEQQVDLVRSTPEQGENGGEVLATDVQFTSPVGTAWQWQTLSDGVWKNIEGGTENFIVISEADLESYDLRCVYTLDGAQYGTRSAKGTDYAAPEAEQLEPMPEGIELNADPTYTELDMTKDDEYAGHFFALTFADGEWVKELHVEAVDDELAESDEFGVFTLVDCDGGSLYAGGATMSMQVKDNDAAGESQVGFEVQSADVDKADGKVTLNVVRTGDMTRVFSVDYATQDGTAAAGKDYVAASGQLVFQGPDFATMPIELELIDDGVKTDEPVSFTVTLSNLLGGGEENAVRLLTSVITVRLTNSGTAKAVNTATMLYLTDAEDASAQMKTEEPVVPAEEPLTVSETDEQEGVTAELKEVPLSERQEIAGSTESVVGNELTANVKFDSTQGQTSYWQPSSYINQYTGDSGDLKHSDGTEWQITPDTYTNGLVGEVTNSRPDDIKKEDYHWGNGCLAYSYKYGGYTQLALDSRFSKYYNHVAFNYDQFARQLSWSYLQFVDSSGNNIDLPNPYTAAHFFSSHLSDYSYTHEGSLNDYSGSTAFSFARLRSVAWNKNTMKDGLWAEGEQVYGFASADISFGSDVAGVRVGEADADVVAAFHGHSYLGDLLAQRRVYTGGIQLCVHLPDGEKLTAQEKKDVLSNLSVKMDPGAGGVNNDGRLYVGSSVSVNMLNAQYRISSVSGMNGVEWSGNTTRAVESDGSKATYTLYSDQLSESMLNNTVTLHVSLERSQKVEMSVAGNIGTGGLSSEAAAVALFAASSPASMEYAYYKTTGNMCQPFAGENGSYDKAALTGKDGQSVYTLFETKNLRTIKLNLNHDDVILFNGNKYAGDETITLSKSEQKMPTLTLYYYNRDYLQVTSLMQASLGSIDLYLDTNRNGVIDTDKDLYRGIMDPTVSYTEDEFAPLFDDAGNAVQYLAHISYTMNPRSYTPPAGQEKLKAQVVPALAGSAVGEEALVKLTVASQPGDVSVEELMAPDQTERNLGILYYDETTDAVVITARQTGSGYIRLKDTATGSYRDMAYTIAGSNYGIDIYNDNQMFTFRDASGAVFDKDTSNDWRFSDNWPTWGLATVDPSNPVDAPSRGTLSVSNKAGTSFSFDSRCDVMDLYFDGRIQVTDQKEGSSEPTVIYTSPTGTTDPHSQQALRLDFGENTAQNIHTITITTLDAKVQFDSLVEYFSSGAPLTPADDQAAPLVFFSRSFPDTASMKTSDGEEVNFDVTVTDTSGLSSLVVRVDDVQLTGLAVSYNKDKTAVSFPLKVTANQTITIMARDKAGNPTIRTIHAQWYENDISINAGPATAPSIKAEIQDSKGNPAADYLNDAKAAYQSSASGNQAGTVTKVELLYALDNVVQLLETYTDPQQLAQGSFDLTRGNGAYLVRVTEEVQMHQKTYTTWAQDVLYMDLFDSTDITGLIGESMGAQTRQLAYTVQKKSGSNISVLTINGIDQKFTPSRWITGTMPLAYSGVYTLEAADQTGTEFTDSYTAKNVPVTAAAGAVTVDGIDGSGSITVRAAQLTGGNYMPEEFAKNKVYCGSYEAVCVKEAEAFAGTLDTQEARDYFAKLAWTALDASKPVTIAEKLKAGNYTVYLRDAVDPDNTAVICAAAVEVQPEEKQPETVTIDDPEYLFWVGVALKLDKMTGGVLRIHAGNYDKMPVIVMETLAEHHNVTLVIEWNGGSTITIRGWQALATEEGRQYWPLSLLAELFRAKKVTPPDAGKDDVVITAPETDKTEPATPSDGGFKENPFPDHAEEPQNQIESWVWIAVVVTAAGAIFLIFWYLRRRTKKSSEQ